MKSKVIAIGKCVNNDGYKQFLTVGKVYKLFRNKGNKTLIEFERDNTDTRGVAYLWRFNILSAFSKIKII